jgi:hypothetical protein
MKLVRMGATGAEGGADLSAELRLDGGAHVEVDRVSLGVPAKDGRRRESAEGHEEPLMRTWTDSGWACVAVSNMCGRDGERIRVRVRVSLGVRGRVEHVRQSWREEVDHYAAALLERRYKHGTHREARSDTSTAASACARDA